MRSSLFNLGLRTVFTAFFLTGATALSPVMAHAQSEKIASGKIAAFDKSMIHQDPDGSYYLSARDKLGVLLEMEDGDVIGLSKIIDQLKASPTASPLEKVFEARLSLAAIQRTAGNFPASNEQLDKLAHALGPIADPERMVTPLGLIIATMRAGNFFLDGDIHAWAVAVDALRRQYFEPLQAFYHIPDLTVRNASQLDLVVSPDTIPEQSVTLSKGETIPFWQSTELVNGHQQINAKGRVTVDGEKTDAVFDTGSATLSVPSGFARRHNLRVIAKSSLIRDGVGHSPFATTQFVIVPSLNMGETVFRNQIASVTSPDSPVIVGLQQLLKLSHVTFSKTGLEFGPEKALNCTGPFVLATFRSGQKAWLMDIVTLNGSQDFTIVDTGSNMPEILEVNTPSLTPSLRQHAFREHSATIAGEQTATVAVEDSSVAFGTQQLMTPVRYKQTPAHLRPLLTTAILNYGTIQFDRNSRVFCVNLQTTR